MITRPLLLVEDDLDDHEMMMFAFQELGVLNPVKHFKDAESALEYLKTTEESPLLIVSDVNMPKMNGLSFKGEIESSQALKSRNIPFVFLSTAASNTHVKEAFSLNAQGFFVKGSSFDALKSTLKTILEYWMRTRHPN
jgi:CheY-like chemotaxis protein